MLNKMYFLLYLLFCFALVSCKDSNSPEPTKIDSTKIKPEISISHQLLDSGYVQFNNITKDIQAIEWQFGDDFAYRTWTSREVSPKFFFQKNGEKTLRIKMKFLTSQLDTSFILKIDVTNALNKPDLQSEMTGSYFGVSHSRFSYEK